MLKDITIGQHFPGHSILHRCEDVYKRQVYLFAKTPAFALSWWLSGLSYDALHGVGNFAIMLVLYRPLRKALKAAKRQIGIGY